MHINKKHFLIIGIVAISGATNCALFREQFSTKARMEKAANYIIQYEEIMVKPNPLELHGGNVSFNIKVKAPDKKMKRSYNFTTDIFYTSGNVYQLNTRIKPENKVGSITLEGTKLKRNNIVQKDMSFAYKKAFNLGYLYAYGTVTKNQSKKKEKVGPFPIYSTKQQVIGIITTSSLVKIPTENEDGKNGMKAYQAIKSAISKEDGSYKTAYELLKNAPNTATNKFNQGLAYLLEDRNYDEAKRRWKLPLS